MRLIRVLVAILLWIAVVPAFAASSSSAEGEEEDFEIQDEGILFDYPRTGLMYKRNVYVEGDDVTNVPNYPTGYNDTTNTKAWKVYVSHVEQDPPSFLTVFMMDDSPYIYSKATIDLRVIVGQNDRASNLVPANQVEVTGIPINKGITRIPVNIHNYKGDMVVVKLIGVHSKLPIHEIDFTDD